MARGKKDGGATLIDVASAAGVSVITASRALRGQGPMSDETRDRVRRAAESLSYRRNPIAASLVSSSSNLVGVIVPSLANIVFVDVLAGIDAAIAPAGFRTIIGVSNYDRTEESRLVDSFLGWRPAALVLTGLEHEPATVARLQADGTRCIEIMDLGAAPVDVMIGFSHETAGRVSARHLLSRGYRRIGYVGHDLTRDSRAAKRHRGFVTALAEAGLALRAERMLPAPSGVAAGRQALADLLAESPDVDAVYFSNDDMAIGGMFHCLSQGIDVPGRLGIMGFNALDIGQELPRPLTTIRTPRREIGLAAGQAALDLSAGRPVARQSVIDFTLIAGATA